MAYSPREKLNALQFELFESRERTKTVFVWIILWTHRAGWSDWAFLPLCFVQCFDSYFIWPIVELHNAQRIPPVDAVLTLLWNSTPVEFTRFSSMYFISFKSFWNGSEMAQTKAFPQLMNPCRSPREQDPARLLSALGKMVVETCRHPSTSPK